MAAFENLEVRAIIYFEREFREVAKEDANNVVRKCDFDSIFDKAEHNIDMFIRKEYYDLESFVDEHAAIFPESKSGLSVRVASHEEVLRYVEASEQNDAVSYFVQKIKDYAERNDSYFVKKETVHNFYHHNCPESVRNIVDANYETFGDFLDAHSSSFPRTENPHGFLVKERNDFATPLSTAAFENLEVRAILHFERKFREIAEDDTQNVIRKSVFSSIFDEAQTNLKQFVDKRYDDFESFVAAHAAIFPESKSGLSVRVASHAEVLRYVKGSEQNDAMSYFVQKIKDYAEQNDFYFVKKETVHNFYNHNCPDFVKNIVDANYDTFEYFLNAHSSYFPRVENRNDFQVKERNNFVTPPSTAAFENLEVQAIVYFAREFREVAEDGQNVVRKSVFDSIFNEAEQNIEQFVREEYDDFESFVDEHATIFPESKSGLSVRVVSHEEVLRYVNASAVNDAVSYFVQKIKDYAERNDFYFVKKETVYNFYHQNCPDYFKNIVDANYETFEDFLNAHSTSFPRTENPHQFQVKERKTLQPPTLQPSIINDCQFEKIGISPIKNFVTPPYTAAFGNLEVRAIIYFEREFREVAEDEANNVVPKCDFDSIFDEAEPYIKEFVEDQYEDFESFVDEHAAIFPESRSRLSVRVASHEEVLRYVNTSAVNDAVCYFVQKIKDYGEQNNFFYVKKETAHNFYHHNCPDYFKNIVDANYETFADFLDAHSSSFPRAENRNGFLVKGRKYRISSVDPDLMAAGASTASNEADKVDPKLTGFEDSNLTGFKVTNLTGFDDRNLTGFKDTKLISSEDTKLISSEDTSLISSEDTNLISSEDTSLISSEDTSLISSEDTSLISSEETSLISSEETSLISSEETSLISSEDTSLISSEDTNLISSEDTNLISSEDTHLISSEDTHLISSEDTHLISSEDTHLISSEDTNVISSEGTNLLSFEEIVLTKEIVDVPPCEPDEFTLQALDIYNSKEKNEHFTFLSLESEIEESVFEMLSTFLRSTSDKRCQTDLTGDI